MITVLPLSESRGAQGIDRLAPWDRLYSRHVDLLMISKGEIHHYCWIKNFSCLVSAQYSGNGHENAYCRFFLRGFKSRAIAGQCTRLKDAKRRCNEHGAIDKQVISPFLNCFYLSLMVHVGVSGRIHMKCVLGTNLSLCPTLWG